MHKSALLLAALSLSAWAGHSVAAPLPPIVPRAASLQCEGRKIELKADCFSYVDEDLACTRQSLVFYDGSTKAKLGERVYKAGPQQEGDDYPIIPDKFGALSCVETKDKEKYIVADMDNGGNCGSCEWHDVYTLDGVLVGTDRDRKKKNKIVADAVDAVFDKKVKRLTGKNELVDFYVQRAKK